MFKNRFVGNPKNLDSLIFNAFFSEQYFSLNKQYIVIDWNLHSLEIEAIPSDSFYRGVKLIENGYLLAYDSLSRVLFNKNVHNLTIIELDSIKSILPFKIQIGGLVSSLPPTPPAPIK